MDLTKIVDVVLGADDFKNAKLPLVFPDNYFARQYLPANTKGRDFIVADLHGSYSLLMGYLLAVDFDPQSDRLILLGDLIDRGPASFECLMLLLQPWVFAVIGNHEWMLLTWMGLRDSNYHRKEHFIANGGEWVLQLTADQFQMLRGPLAEKLLALPYVMTVMDTACAYHVAHGELLAEGRKPLMLKDADLTEENVRRLATHIAWSRRMKREAEEGRRSMAERGLSQQVEGVYLSPAPVEPGLSLTYVGHNIMAQPTLHRSHAYIDRGAYTQAENSELFVVEHSRFVAGLKDLGLIHG